MAVIERVGFSETFERELFVLEAADPIDCLDALLENRHIFACLIAWDARLFSDEDVKTVAHRLLTVGCVYACCWGPDCQRIETLIDLAELELHPDGPYTILTTSHSKDPLSEALWYLLSVTWPDPEFEDDCRTAIGLSIGSPEWAHEIRSALTNPSDFCKRVLDSHHGD